MLKILCLDFISEILILQRILFIWKFRRLRIRCSDYFCNWLLFARISSLNIIFTIIQYIGIFERLFERIVSYLNISLAFLKNILWTFDDSTQITYITFTIIIWWEIWIVFWIFIQLYFSRNLTINMIDYILILFYLSYIFWSVPYFFLWSAKTFWVRKSVISNLAKVNISIMAYFGSLVIILY